MEFVKMHGTGNDFVMIDAREGAGDHWPALARAMCDRHFGVGSDGLLLLKRSSRADLRMVMYNPDGSEAEMCGNGIRCFAKHAYDSGILQRQRMAIETGAGVKDLSIETEGGMATRVTVNMGRPEFRPAEIPIAVAGETIVDYPLEVDGTTLQVTGVSMGNPHAVHFLPDSPVGFPLESLGPIVEHHPLFPRRINFEVAEVVSSEQVVMRVWERGAGITLACGTGACAVFAAAHLKKLVGNEARLSLPGGDLTMRWSPEGEILMTGPASYVFRGTWLAASTASAWLTF